MKVMVFDGFISMWNDFYKEILVLGEDIPDIYPKYQYSRV